ncbi:MAG: 23S rRNA (uracil(1939)-C(5))-methyltransferase RlmD [Candidatus Aminicenantes bacterium]|nr:23S rRNA (uracil(1939)-C(5))-methyltransferase RlmD [Candidatus Aminicenantes bacterium]
MIEMKLTQIAYNGLALGRSNGKVYFVPYALPGERVMIELVKEKKDWAYAKLNQVIDPSPHRITPTCPYFGPSGCGGCHWQHIDYGAQLEFKSQIVRDQLIRIGGLKTPKVKPASPVGLQWGYRNHVQFHPVLDGWGFVAAKKNDVIKISQCPLLPPVLNDLFQQIKVENKGLNKLSLRAGLKTGSKLIIVESRENVLIKTDSFLQASFVQVFPDKTYYVHEGKDHIYEGIEGLNIRVSRQSFFQVNTDGAEYLVKLVRNYLALAGKEIILDLYSGVGLFSLCLAYEVRRVIAVESLPAAVKDFRFNIRSQKIKNILVHQKFVGTFLKEFKERVDAVVLDPPRRGCGPNIIKELARLSPQRIVYVSCDPATLARDSGYLRASGYHLMEAQPLDFFPQTYHIETVALFVREV